MQSRHICRASIACMHTDKHSITSLFGTPATQHTACTHAPRTCKQSHNSARAYANANTTQFVSHARTHVRTRARTPLTRAHIPTRQHDQHPDPAVGFAQAGGRAAGRQAQVRARVRVRVGTKVRSSIRILVTARIRFKVRVRFRVHGHRHCTS